MTLSTGAQFGFYEIRRPLGSGGRGVVYDAWDTRLQRPVALKLLLQTDREPAASSKQLVREARAAAALNHPNVCTIYEVGEIDGTPFIAMELIEGQTLHATLGRGPLAPPRVCRLGRQLADALAGAHAAGVIHRDLKSANVMVTSEGHIKVLDFGIARRLSGPSEATRTDTTTDTLAGTLPYMAPEVLRGHPPTTQSDIWALGIVLYEMIAGRRPFVGDTNASTSAAILRDPLPPLPADTPHGLARVVNRCLEKEEASRPRTANEVALALDIADPMPLAPTVLPEQRRRHRIGVLWTLTAVTMIAAAGGMVWRSRPAGGPTGPVDAIAVLPFANLSGDPDQEFFSDGITEAVITDLGKISALRVIARGSVMQYKTKPKPPAETARELGVDALVNGSVLRVDDRVRITVQLIAPEDGRVLWSDRFEGDTRDILALHADIATAVAQQVRATIGPSEAQQLASPYSPDPKAHELYLLGRYHAYRKNPESATKAVEYLLDATRVDPGFALAHAALAEAYRLREIWGGAGIGAFAEESRDAATRALNLDARLPEAHFAMAIVLSQRDWNWAAAETEFRRAIEGRPSLSDAHAEYSFYLQGLGRFEEAIAAVRRATALDPLSPDHLSQEGRAFFRARRYDEALDRFGRALELDPNFGSALTRLIDTYLVMGRFKDVEKYLQKRGDALGNAWSQTAQLYAKTGRIPEARALLAKVERGGTAAGGAGTSGALVLMALGDYDHALDHLERIVRRRQLTAFSLRDPRFDPIALSPRFRQILKTMNLPE